MSAIVEADLTESSFENRALSYAVLQRANSAKYFMLYDRLQIENSSWLSVPLNRELGISPLRQTKYRQLLGPK